MPKYHAALKELDEDKLKIENLAEFVRMLGKTLKQRQFWWHVTRAHTVLRVRVRFIDLLRRRGFNGRLDFQHEKNEIHIVVRPAGDESQPGSVDGSSRSRMPRNLSGGERSFSTVSLLLAMWGVAGCPLRCLDEWDVFLDHVNRALAARMLIEGARESGGKQYILITPQVSLTITCYCVVMC